LLRRIWKYAVWDRRVEVAFAYSPASQGDGKTDPDIVCYDADNRPPPALAEQLFPAGKLLRFNLMRHRMLGGSAKVLCIVRDGVLIAYGWIQDWGPYRRKYRILTEDARMLGPYWVRPEMRGQGLYGRMLAHSIAVCEDRREVPPLIFAGASNKPSLRGIEKAGFVRLGTYEFTTCCFRRFCSSKAIEQDNTLEDVLTES